MINFVGATAMAQAQRVLGVVLLAAACSGSPSDLSPASPEATVRSFMNAVHAGNLAAMGDLWGSANGPARGDMAPQVLEQRLTVIRIYLAHEQFEVLPPSVQSLPSPGQQVLEVRLTRKGCAPVVPFTLVRHGDGWLISNIDIAAAGNPERACGPRDAARNPEAGSRR